MDDFLRDSVVSIIVPVSSDESLSERLQHDGELATRSTLYFDENLKVVVVLETPQCPEEPLQTCLQLLQLKIEAWAVSPDAEKRNSGSASPTRDLLATELVTVSNDPVTLLKQHDETDNVSFVLHWEVSVILNKPRIRLNDPSIVFVPIAIIAPQNEDVTEDDYVEAFSVQEPNLLQPLANGGGLADVPYLPLSRLERVVPARHQEDPRVRLRHIASQPIKAYPAVMARLKYLGTNTYSPLPSKVASLDIEIIPFIDIHGSIENITVSMSNGSVKPLMSQFLPMKCKSKDCITFLYTLQASQQLSSSTSNTTCGSPTANANIDTLSISLEIILSVGSSSTAKITMEWTTNVDFSKALNPSFGAPSQPMQRTNRPAGLNFGTAHAPMPNPGSISSVTSSSLQPISQLARSDEVVVVSFTSASEPARVGKPFTWKVLVVNRSLHVAKIAIVPLPKIQRVTTVQQNYAKIHAPKASSISVTANTAEKPSTGIDVKDDSNSQQTSIPTIKRQSTVIAKAILDENVLYALHHSPNATPTETDVISLTAELHIGPLRPGQCHEAEIKFLAFKSGTFTIDAVRVVDLVREAEFGVNATGVIQDLREVPDVIVVD